MHASWQQWLNRPGVEMSTDLVTAVPASDSPNRSVALTDYSIISITGPDAHKFLQGQLSCDLAGVDREGQLPGAHCNIKGHMHSLYEVIAAGEERYWLRIRTDMAEDALTLLKKYIIFSKAEAELETELLGIGLIGPDSQRLSQTYTPQTGASCNLSQSMSEIWLPADQLEATLGALQSEAPLATRNDWELAGVEAAIPELFPATREAFIPQMVNLQVFEGVSFTKGCYTGQEIVTRLQHRGQLKRPMYLAEVESSQPMLPGTELASEAKSSVGKIVRAAKAGDNLYRVLAVIIKDQAEQQTIHLESTEGPCLKLSQLPYELDPRLFESKR
ncbi:YgfZ/GcvT domain-containing protein [Marinobacterium stanieri]|uniref:CAF17-like 4Fe-4S cluster assembly/insertion protein YgfZ n=1 Tax=Marinobacterium stanieri TaxID=49186 RepID=UPI00025577E3|nr:folate-binding protein YgfZ [Marinobacterium stanieri]